MPRKVATTEPRELTDSEMPEEEPMAIVSYSPPQQSLVVGMGALAALDDADFDFKLNQLTRGQERFKELVDRLLNRGEDYGNVPGIAKPFLQKPGAEKLGNFFGYAVRFEADRIIGDGITSPPLAYHIRSYAHLGDFDGPVVAQGYGEANVWEERYRYRTAKATCPTCGREGLIRGKADSRLKGKWWCPSREGGCNSTFEPNATKPDGSLLVTPPGRVENDDMYGLANTLIKMGEKRAHVDVILRATGTSGFFSQDEDSPSVRAQSGEQAPEPEVTVTAGPEATVGRGARGEAPTAVQLQRLVKVSKDRDLGPAGIATLIERLFDQVVEGTDTAVSRAVQAMTADQVGRLILAAEEGVISEHPMDAADEVAYATHPDDIGAK